MGCLEIYLVAFGSVLLSKWLGMGWWGTLVLLALYLYLRPHVRSRIGSASSDGQSDGAAEDGDEDAEAIRAESEKQRRERNRVLLGAFAGTMAKLAKADGRVDESEIQVAEAGFRRMGLDEGQRAYCIRCFRAAKDDDLSALDYARRLRSAAPQASVRVFLYELLWEMACADGSLNRQEDAILRLLPDAMAIDFNYYVFCRTKFTYFRRAGGFGQDGSGGARGGAPRRPSAPTLDDDYALLGTTASATDDEVKKAYRLAAKKYHPDLLRAQGVPDKLVAEAQEKMAKVNDAWSRIRQARGL